MLHGVANMLQGASEKESTDSSLRAQLAFSIVSIIIASTLYGAASMLQGANGKKYAHTSLRVQPVLAVLCVIITCTLHGATGTLYGATESPRRATRAASSRQHPQLAAASTQATEAAREAEKKKQRG